MGSSACFKHSKAINVQCLTLCRTVQALLLPGLDSLKHITHSPISPSLCSNVTLSGGSPSCCPGCLGLSQLMYVFPDLLLSMLVFISQIFPLDNKLYTHPAFPGNIDKIYHCIPQPPLLFFIFDIYLSLESCFPPQKQLKSKDLNNFQKYYIPASRTMPGKHS